MKKKELLMYIIAPILLIGITITIIVAWYTNTHKIGNIEGDTSDNVISYTLNDTNVNVYKYSVSNLTFFDIDNVNETKYFLDMVTVVKLEIENVTNNSLYLTIDYSYIPKYQYTNTISTTTSASNIFNTTLPSGASAISKAYCYGFISENKLEKTNIKENDSIENNISSYRSKIENIKLSGKSQITYYLYLFGVQVIDTSNNDFLKQKFNFTLSLTSKVQNTNPSETSRPTTKNNN